MSFRIFNGSIVGGIRIRVCVIVGARTIIITTGTTVRYEYGDVVWRWEGRGIVEFRT